MQGSTRVRLVMAADFLGASKERSSGRKSDNGVLVANHLLEFVFIFIGRVLFFDSRTRVSRLSQNPTLPSV